MNSVMDLIEAIDSSGKDYDVFLQDLFSTNNDLPSNIDEVNHLQNTIVSHINSRLNQSSTRHDGLSILSHVLPQCSKDLLSKYAILWIAKTSQIFEDSQSGVREITLACKVLGALIVKCKDLPELQKTISMQTVKQLVIAISNLQPEKRSGATLYLVATILYHYKEPSERLQSSITRMILPLIDADQKSLVQAGANCYALLTRVTERSFKPPAAKPSYTGWVYSQALLCNSLHAIMDDLFSGLIELENNDVWEKLDLPGIPEDNVIDYYRSLERRFENLCIYLSTMLRGCSGKNSVCPNNILQVLCRGLAVTPSNLRDEDSFKKQMLHFILPKLHISLFAVLNSFIEGFGKELMPFAITILQLYQQTLKWTEKVGEGKTSISGGKPFKNVRIAVYQSLTMWLSKLGTMSGIDIVVDDFMSHFLKDIIPEKERVLLTVQKTQHLSKRALKRFKDNQYENSASLGSASTAKKDPRVNAELCKNALITLENIFFSVGCTLKQSFYRVTQNVVVPLLYDSYLGKSEKTVYDADKTCRLHLLRVLRAIQLHPHPSTPPPTQYSIEIFGMAMRDDDPRIVREAKLVTAELEKIVHPSAPTLQFPVSNSEETGEKTLGIRWSRPTIEEQNNREKDIVRVESNVWEKFRETMSENVPMDHDQRTILPSNSTQVEKPCEPVNEIAENSDGPTPSKQQRLLCNDPSELMDTSEDEIVVPGSPKDAAPVDRNQPHAYQSPRKEKMIDSVRIDGSQKNVESVKSQNEASYLTLKEIQGDENDSRPGVRQNESTNDNEDSNNVQSKSNKDIAQKVEKTDQQVDKCFDDNSDDEAILSLFCDELKDS